MVQKLNRTDKNTLHILRTEGKELTIHEIAEKAGATQEQIKKSLWKLFQL